ncbi:MAG: LytTR family transcriptional regulator DNA-binding domain-containing protein [Prevotellaceae bacterium]|jgi:hypothetical protein|nr:LytTR family transcriptional regulator DNA-binding domain-containing protein [Prevotellaceae bacterium]
MNWRQIISRFLIWAAFAVSQALSVAFATELLPSFVFALLYSTLFALVAFALQSMIRYGNFSQCDFFQQFTNYFGLVLFTVIVSVGISYGVVLLIFGQKIFAEFLMFLPLEILVSILLFWLLIYYFKSKEKSGEIEQIEPILQKKNTEIIEQIAVKTGQNLNIVAVNDIFYFSADGDYVQIHTESKKFLKEQTMKYFAEHLPVDRFLRIHRSYIVNIRKVARIEQYGKQSLTLTLTNGDKLKISTVGYRLLKARLGI